MKRYIRNSESAQILKKIEKIDVIAIVDDARTQGLKQLPIVAAKRAIEDYDQYTMEELMWLDDSILREIESPYALDNLMTAIKEHGNEFFYRLTPRQEKLLSNYYKNRENSEVLLYEEDIQDLINQLKACKHVTGPHYRESQPEKNFEEVHGIYLTRLDYMNIIKDLKASEFVGAVKSAVTHRLGALLYEFIHDPKGYKIGNADVTLDEDIRIYIKILPEYEKDCTVAIISFHDALDGEYDVD